MGRIPIRERSEKVRARRAAALYTPLICNKQQERRDTNELTNYKDKEKMLSEEVQLVWPLLLLSLRRMCRRRHGRRSSKQLLQLSAPQILAHGRDSLHQPRR